MAEASSADVPLLRTDLAHLLERITDGFFALDSAWRIVYINAEARSLLRAGDADVLGTYWLDAFPRARGTAFEREYARAMREQVPVQFVEFSSTSERWLEVKAYPSPDGISVYFRDVTARVRAERELNEQKRRIVEVLESITDAFASLDRNLTITYVNGRMEEIYGMPRESLIGKHLRGFMPKGVNDANIEHFEEALRERRTVTYESFHATTQRWYEARIYPSTDGLSVYLRDITTRKLGEMHMRELNEELERRVAERTVQLELANKELESFAYSVSHDLRAPLRAIDGFSQALEEDYGSHFDAQGTQYLGRVRAAARRMGNLIDALLKLARVARAAITPVPVDLTKIAQAVAADLRSIEPEREVRFAIEPGLRAMGEPLLVRAVLENLMGNAWKFTRDTPAAAIEFGREGQEYYVRDNGAGFDMAYANKLFGAFQRLHSADEYEGTGIGLATVARIVHRHGGLIRAHGAVRAGATFWFTLPQVEDET